MTVTHQRGPTTAPRGQFELLCLQPDPVPGSSDHLGIMYSYTMTMWTQSLVRTPAQHNLPRPVKPRPPGIHTSSPPVAELQR